MLSTVIKPNNYQDSISLMLLTKEISKMEGIHKLQVMMGTDANKSIFDAAGLLTEEAEKASSNDMMIVLDIESKDIEEEALQAIDQFLKDLAVKKEDTGNGPASVRNWDGALKALPDANLALISVAGTYAAAEIENALDNGLNAFVFSDNVPKEEEVRLKKKAHEKGLLVMGPDCGTGLIGGIPLAFTNVIRPGNISIVGASGTGIQEVSTIIDRLGGGVTHAIGTGGRDLSDEVGAITMKDTLLALAEHDPTEVIVVISKPPAKEVRDEVVTLLHGIDKPVVAVFLGENPTAHEGEVYFAHTLEETAHLAVALSQGKSIEAEIPKPQVEKDAKLEGKVIKGLYSGGTLANEAGILISEALDLGGVIKEEGYVLRAHGHEILDLGDDLYTQGRPHPMIDPEIRVQKIKETAQEDSTGIILLDVVLGYGAADMAETLAPVIEEVLAEATKANRSLHIVGTIVGTKNDPQDFDAAKKVLEKAGMHVTDSNAQAVDYSLQLLGKHITATAKTQKAYQGEKIELPAANENIIAFLNQKPEVINIGIADFNEPIQKFGSRSVQFDWKPAAGGNVKLIQILQKIKQLKDLGQQNNAVVDRFRQGSPYLVDVVPAGSVIDELNSKTLLHAGPPIKYEDMSDPMQGSCVGAVLFEGWAKEESEARSLLENGEINLIPCHHVNAVGPMGGITSGSMPVLVVENRLEGNRAYCTLNEGIGRVLRFGAYDSEVIDRLTWMKDTLGPVLGEAIRSKKEGINVNVIMAKAITMGDEFHQRNIAASLVFLKEVAPLIVALDITDDKKEAVIQFLADTDQFFLNIMMATGKSIVDAAKLIEEGTIVTTLSRNGQNFGIKVSGLGEEWFTAPVNTPEGLFFTGFSQEDANPDMGDSAIAETVGFGGMAMIAAPGVTRFVGAGGFDDAKRVSDEMDEICIANNANFTIPTWDFQGTPLGIDICKVVETGITPLINTGIAGKVAGLGQVGAGTVRAPIQCFEKALVAFAEKWDLV